MEPPNGMDLMEWNGMEWPAFIDVLVSTRCRPCYSHRRQPDLVDPPGGHRRPRSAESRDPNVLVSSASPTPQTSEPGSRLAVLVRRRSQLRHLEGRPCYDPRPALGSTSAAGRRLSDDGAVKLDGALPLLHHRHDAGMHRLHPLDRSATASATSTAFCDCHGWPSYPASRPIAPGAGERERQRVVLCPT